MKKAKTSVTEQEAEKMELKREQELGRSREKEEPVWRESFYRDAGRARIKAGAIGAIGALAIITLLFLLSMITVGR